MGLRAQAWEELTQTWEEAFAHEHVLGQSALDPVSQLHFNVLYEGGKIFHFVEFGRH